MKEKSFQFGRTRRHLTSEEKGEILREYEQSGHSLLAFAGKHGLCYASLLRWRRAHGTGTNLRAQRAMEASPGFVPVQIETEVNGEYVLSWPGGVALKIPRQFEPDVLRRLLTVLEVMR